MLINNQLTLDVLAAWTDDQNHPHRDRTKKPIPSEQDFAVLLDTMFKASLLHEEGKSVSTSVTWVSRNDFEMHEIGRMRQTKLALEFDTPIEFEAHNLAKLNGIVNGKTGTLLACCIGVSSYIWGVCYFNGRSGAIGEIPVGLNETRHFSPDYPTVTITGVGSIQITRGGSVIGRMEGGKFLRAQAAVFTSFMLGQYLYRLIGIDVDLTSRKFKNDEDADVAASFFKCVEFIIEVLSQRRTGATVIFVPPSQNGRALEETDIAWKTNGSLEVDVLQRARLNFEKMNHESKSMSGTLFRLKIDEVLRHRLRSLIDLAGIDGALLLTPSFEVIGFGAKLKSPKWERDVQHGPLIQPVEKQQLDFSRLGTRHNSALNFVGSVEGAVAFVASSDGPIRALVKSTEERIWYWPDCRVSMFSK
jgi:hypothetical protein